MPEWCLRLCGKKYAISVLIASVIAMITIVKVTLLSTGADLPMGVSLLQVASSIALALSLQIIVSAIVGTIIPMISSHFRMDPAVMTSPLLTSIVDITGIADLLRHCNQPADFLIRLLRSEQMLFKKNGPPGPFLSEQLFKQKALTTASGPSEPPDADAKHSA